MSRWLLLSVLHIHKCLTSSEDRIDLELLVLIELLVLF